MLLKNHLIEVFKKASLENNFLLKENIVLKWVHRFGIDSLNDLLIYSPVIKEHQLEKENHEQITLMDEVNEENHEQISLELLKSPENLKETKCESNDKLLRVMEYLAKNKILKNQNKTLIPKNYLYLILKI